MVALSRCIWIILAHISFELALDDHHQDWVHAAVDTSGMQHVSEISIRGAQISLLSLCHIAFYLE